MIGQILVIVGGFVFLLVMFNALVETAVQDRWYIRSGWATRRCKRLGHVWRACGCTRCEATQHDWNGCKCTRCSKTRDEQHEWNGCTCTRCEAIQHDWNGCTCTRCGAVRESGHKLDNKCECTQCGRTIHCRVVTQQATDDVPFQISECTRCHEITRHETTRENNRESDPEYEQYLDWYFSDGRTALPASMRDPDSKEWVDPEWKYGVND
jgi:hypothetical protein